MKKKTVSPEPASPTANGIAVHCAHDRLVDVTELVANPRNPNRHPDSQVALLAKIIRHQGWRSPVVVSKRSGFVVAGHGRLQAAKLLQVQVVPVNFQEFATEADEWAHVIADNRIAELAETDVAALKDLLIDLDSATQDFDMDLSGFDKDELERVINSYSDGDGVDAEPQIDRAAELMQEWGTKLGQLWELGDHRLLCGDSKDEKARSKLLADCDAVAVVTDPPYLLDYGGGGFSMAEVKSTFKEKLAPLQNYDPAEMLGMLQQIKWHSAFVWTGKETVVDLLVFAKTKKLLFNILIWCKDNPPPFTHKNFLPDLEYCIYFAKPGRHFTEGLDYKEYSKWFRSGIHEGKHEGDNLHPTIKPLEFITRMVKVGCPPGGVIFEPYCGSGTTLLAAERTGRICHAIEIEPKYVAVILQRFKDATGKTPKLLT